MDVGEVVVDGVLEDGIERSLYGRVELSRESYERRGREMRR